MTMHLQGDVVHLTGACPAGDAEELWQLLLDHPAAAIDWRGCEQAHTAVVQVLLAARRELRGPPRGVALRPVDAAIRRD